MSSSNGTVMVSAVRTDGSEVKLEKLRPSDLVRLAEALTSQRRALLRQNLTDAGVSGKDAVTALNAFDSRPVERADLIDALYTPHYQSLAILESVRHQKPDATMADVDALQLNPSGLLDVALGLFGLQLKAPAKNNAVPAGESPHPLSGGAGDTQKTSPGQTDQSADISQTPTESAST